MLFDNVYLSIDMVKTGERLGTLIKESEYSIRDIQRILHLSCPQPVYRWMRGQILPSIDHLYVLAKILGVHMEELLIPEYGKPCGKMCETRLFLWRRITAYGRRYQRAKAA